MKRLVKAISMLLAIVMVVGLLPLSIIAEDIHSTHTVQFKLNYNGARKIPSQKVADGECAVQPEDVTREGWIFEYWYVKTGEGKQKFDLSQPITGDVTLYASWDEDIEYWGPIWNRNIVGSIADSNKNVTYTVTFDGNGENTENIPAAQTVKKGEYAVEPSDPNRSGYHFGGWYTDAAGTIAYDFTTEVTADITLYAKWESDTIISDNNNYIYIPDEKNASYDPNTSTLYYNNLINIFTCDALDNNHIEKLCNLVDGILVGKISRNINFIQIRIDAVDYLTMNEKVELLNNQAEVLYAYHEIPLDITSDTTNPWNSNSNSPERDRGNENAPDGNDWWAEAIGAYTSWGYNSHIDETVTVGIIDNGFDVDHEDLTGKIEFLDNYRTNSEGDHGTHVAGLISANNNSVGLRGVCDTAQLLCADWTPNTEDSDSSNYISLLATGEYILIISDMISNGAKVINNSWGYHVSSYSAYEKIQEEENDDNWWDKLLGDYKAEYQEYLEAMNTSAEDTAIVCAVLIAELINSGNDDFIIVQAAGNGWDNDGPGYNALEYAGCFISITDDVVNSIEDEKLDGVTFEDIDDHILIVAAAENDTVLFGNAHIKYDLTSFSNYGESVDIAAPGYNVFSTICNNKYTNYPGTSMAAPIVAGAVAQIWSINPELNVSEVRDYLFDNSVEDAYGVGDGKDFSYPMLNIGEAVKAVVDDKYSNKGYIVGKLYDSITLNGINGAKITCYNDDFEFTYVAYSEIDGTIRAKANIPSNIRNCDIKIEKTGYETKVIYNWDVENRGIDLQNIALDSIGGCNITGIITMADTDTDMTNNLPLEGVSIVIPLTGYMDAVATTNSNGEYIITDLPIGTYTMTVSKEGYIPVTETITVDGTETELIYNITIEAISTTFSITHTNNGVTTDILTASPIEVYNGVASMTWTINSSAPWKIVTNRGDWFSLSVDGKSVGLNSTFDAGETELKLNISGYTDSRSDGTIAFEVGGEIYTVEIFQIASIIASLTGTIKDGDADSPTYGQVLEGVSLDVYDSTGNKVGDTVKSNENGVVAFDFPAADTYKFVFSLVGYKTVTVDTVIINENTPSLGQYVMMRAEATTSVSGTTTPGTKLELLDENGNVLAETVADANGNYEFKDIPGWDGTIFRIRIKDTTVTIEAVGGATEVTVDTTVTIFTVSTPDTVQIDNEVGAISEWEIESSHPWTVTKSGDTSWYTLNMESGNAGITDFVVTALGTTDSYRESTLTFALNNSTFDVTIYQDFCQTVSGSVVEKTENSDEIGIENVVVVVRKAGDSSWYSQVETDVNGQYTLVFEDAGEYVMTYSHPEYNMVTVEDIVITADSTTFEAVEMVAVTNTVTGIITNIDGSVMEGVTVTVSTEEYPDKSMTTGTDGKFTFTLPIGWYDIIIAKNGESKVYRSYFNIEDTSIDIGNLVMPLTLEGTVNDNENPIVNATVTLIDRTTGSNIETTQSDETGTFRFKFYTAGTYYLNISAAGYSEEFITNINITKNTSSIGDFTLTAIDITASGTYENLTWTIDASGTLSISGTGEIPHISYSSAPWYNHLSSVNSIVINEGITGVDFDAFNGKYQYSTISLPSSITKLESLSDIYQAEFVVDEDNQHFMSENGVLFNADQTILLRYVKNGDYSVPSGVIGLAEYAFAHSSVRQLDLPDTLQVIGNYAFYQSYITELNIPASVINIGTNTFSYCDNLQNIHVAEKNLHYESDNGVLFLKGKQTLIKYPGGRDDETYCIPDGVTKVLEEAFTDSMEYNGGVYSYGDTTHVYGLQRITFPASVKFIGWDDYSSDYSYISHLIFLGACPDMMGGYVVPSDGVYPTPGSVIHYTVGHSGSSNHRWTSSIWQYETSGFAYPFKTICEGAIATVTGTVKDETGTALEGVRIKGYNSSGYPVSAAITDGNGSFTIQFEEAGKYRFTFSADGYELYNLNDFAIDGTTTSFGVISMKEGVSIVASGKNGSASWLLDSEGTLTLSGTGGDLFTNLWSKYRTDVVTVVIENGITRVSGIWNGHSNLQKLQIGSTLQVMLEDFSNCEKLNHIEVAENNPYFSCKDGILYSKDQSVLYKYPPAREDTAFVIPDTVSIIGEAAFQRCVNLNEIIIPIGVTEIQTSAFRGCVIQSLSLPNSVVSIGEEGFYNCYMLKTVEIPGSLTSIGTDAFDACGSLAHFSVDSGNPMYCSVDGILFSKDMTVLMCYPPEKRDVSAYTVPDSVVSIPTGIENDYLTEINLGKNVADIGSGFRYCRNITAINVAAENLYYASLEGVLFDKSIRTLLEYPKAKTEQSYVIPDSVTVISAYAFYSSNALISIYVPEGVTTIGDGAMGYCDRLSQVYFYGNVPENFGRNIFSSLYDDSSAVLYYISGKSGWTSPTWTAPDGKVYNSATWEP